MTNKSLIENITSDILSAYKDPLNPEFSFILDRYKKGMYEKLKKSLNKQYKIQDLSDFNYSSCLTWDLSDKINDEVLYRLNLSLVGLYAILGSIKKNLFITEDLCNLSKEDKDIISLIKLFNIIILNEESLNLNISIQINDDDIAEEKRSCIYNLLFERL